MKAGDYISDDFYVNQITLNYITLHSPIRIPRSTLYEVMEARGYLAISSPITQDGYCYITFRKKS